MVRSALTQGLEELLATGDSHVQKLVKRLYHLDDSLQDAHIQAKQDEEYGEKVVQCYEAFLNTRQELVAELQQRQAKIPWQLRMRVDEIELTLRSRKRAAELAGQSTNSAKDEEKVTKDQPKSSTQIDSAPMQPRRAVHPKDSVVTQIVLVFVVPLIIGILALVFLNRSRG